MSYGDIAKDWESVLAHYEPNGLGFEKEMHRLVCTLIKKGYPASGLCAVTSHFCLLLGQSQAVLDNPHLKISPPGDGAAFKMEYWQPGGIIEWEREVEAGSLSEAVDNFLVRRVRWFRAGA